MGVASVPLLAFGFETTQAASLKSPSFALSAAGIGRMVGQIGPTKFGRTLLLPGPGFDLALPYFGSRRALNRRGLQGREFDLYR